MLGAASLPSILLPDLSSPFSLSLFLHSPRPVLATVLPTEHIKKGIRKPGSQFWLCHEFTSELMQITTPPLSFSVPSSEVPWTHIQDTERTQREAGLPHGSDSQGLGTAIISMLGYVGGGEGVEHC